MGKAKVTELKKVDVGFVSFVTEGANGRKFQIFKSKDYTEKPAQQNIAPRPSVKKAKYSMRELIESIVRSMFSETRPAQATADSVSDILNDKTIANKETQPMNEILKAIMKVRDEIIAAISGSRTASQEPSPPTAPGTSNSFADPDLALSKQTDEKNAQVALSPSAQPVSPPETLPKTTLAEQTPAQPAIPPQQIQPLKEIEQLTGIVAALAKQVEALTGKVDSIAKQRSLSNAISDDGTTTTRRQVEKTAKGSDVPDFSNIFA